MNRLFAVFVLACALFVVLPEVRSEQIQPPPRIELPWGFVAYGNNEVTVASTVFDASGLGLAAPAGQLNIGHVNFGWLRPVDGQKEQLVLIQGKQSEAVRHLPLSDRRAWTGEVTIHLRDGSIDGPDDAQFVKVFQLRPDSVWVIGLGEVWRKR